jgi:diguanylate cyclase (GGDEF)-like protein
MIKVWGSYRKTKDTSQLKTFSSQCTEVAHEIATFPLFALQQVISSILKASNKQIKQQKDTKEFIKEVDWLMNQLIRGQSEQNDIFLQHGSSADHEDLLASELGKHASRLNRLNKPHVAIIDDQQSIGQSLCATLQDFALNASYFSSVAEFEASSSFAATDLVLLDIVMPGISETEVFDFAKRLVSKGIKVISCSSKFTFETRLLAVRASVSDYVVKPVNTYVLVEKIGRALKLQSTRKHNLVIVDDQETMGTFYKTVLEQMGCEVTFFESAHALFKSLDDLNPDMFLLDMMMPDVDGLEVAKMLRQEHKFDFAPILFLTADEQVENRIAAIDAGADDVINKVSSINTITSQVMTRLNRASQVRAFVAKDPLTGVLNHGQIVESANQALRSSKRRKTCSAIAVIDVDLFKKVNDTYGHIAGDKVLSALGQLMSNSIRETDKVGRYGGEEFVIVFDECTVDDAAKKVQMIKEIFSNMQFAHNKTHFTVSFSAGLVNLNDYENVQTAVSFADKALYRAKQEGRNKVLMYRKSSK